MPGLRAMLLDRSMPTNLRTCAAQALANIGGPAARKALEEARVQVKEPFVRKAVGYALEDLKAAGEAAEGP